MKRLIVASAALLVLLAALLAQDGPGSVGSDTVARRRRPAADSTSPTAPGSTAPATTTPPPAAPPASTDLPKIPSKLTPKAKDDGGPAAATFSADTSLVTVDVAVVDNKNNFVPTIKREYFRILEDNVPQTIKQFSLGQAPMTVALVIEFSKLFQWYRSNDWFLTLQTANAFLSTMKRDDYVAIIRYDLRTQIVTDITNDPAKLQEGLRSFIFPDFSEANLFDALTDTADRMSKIQGRKAILTLTSGVDTFSKITFDQTRRKLQDSGVPIFSIRLLQMINPGGMESMTLLQADNEMKTFTKETGGQAFFPRWPAEIGDVFNQMQGAMRNQYTLAYSPSNQEHDGKFRKITVQLIDPATNQPVVMMDEKHKPIKYTIIAKQGYKAPRAVE
jgi:Ca-activated chloride channel family protein